MADPATPIIVSDTPTPAQVQAALRQLGLGLSSFLTALGFSGAAGKFDLLLQFSGPIAFLIVFVLGQLHTRSQAKKLATVAEAAPNSVAIVHSAGSPTVVRALLPLLLAGAALFAGAPLLGGCASAQGALAAVDSPVTRSLPAVATAAPRASTLDEKAWIAATNTWGAAVYAYNQARPHLTPAQVALGRKTVAEGRAIRLAGDAALDAANATNLGAQAAALARLVDQLDALRAAAH